VFLLAGGMAQPARAFTASAGFHAVVEAEDATATIGDVNDSRRIGDQPAGLSAPLTGYSGSGFLDFSNPVASSDWRGTIPVGHDGATWHINVPSTGIYRLRFVYNNPGTKWNGSRNARDERNMRVTVNGNSYTGADGWIGWMIFSVSGYNGTAQPDALQTADTVAQNRAWNNNFMYVPLRAGDNTLRLSLEAPPGQGVYDGPNLDRSEVDSADDLFVDVGGVPSKRGAFQHPGLYVTSQQLASMRRAKEVPDSVSAKGYERLVASPLSSCSYARSDGYYSTVERGPYNNPDVGSSQFSNDGTAVFYNALRWYLDGDVCHAQKAIELLNGWANTLQRVVNNDAKLIVALTAPQYLNGAEIIKHVYNADPSVPAAQKWSAQDMARFDRLVREVFYNTIAGYYPQANGNWDANIAAANLAIGVYLDDHAIFNRALEQFYRGDVVPGTLSMGSLPAYIYPTGESQESNRDQGHAGLGLQGFAETSEISWNQGIDVFGAYGHRLLAAARYYGRYALGAAVPSETFISDKGRGAVSTPLFEVLANHAAAAGAGPDDLALINRVLAEKYRSGDQWISSLVFQTPPGPADVSALRSLVELNSARERARYTADSWAAFAIALNNASSVLREGNSSQAVVDFATAALAEAVQGLAAVADGGVGGVVPATLSLTLGAPAAFRAFVPGVEARYTATTTANVLSTAGDAVLAVSDPSTTSPGHLVNGAFSLAQPLEASVAGSAPVAVSGTPAPLAAWRAPV